MLTAMLACQLLLRQNSTVCCDTLFSALQSLQLQLELQTEQLQYLQSLQLQLELQTEQLQYELQLQTLQSWE